MNDFNARRLCKNTGFLSKMPVFVIGIIAVALILLQDFIFISPDKNYWLPTAVGDYLFRN